MLNKLKIVGVPFGRVDISYHIQEVSLFQMPSLFLIYCTCFTDKILDAPTTNLIYS